MRIVKSVKSDLITSIQHGLTILSTCVVYIVLLWILSCFTFSEVAIALPPPPPIIASLFHFSGTRPTNLGIQDGKLAPCPSTPNCVSSQAVDATHVIAPLRYNGSSEAAFNQLRSVIRSLPAAQVITESDRYLYAEFTSALMGFVDDVEFFLDEDANVIQVRSASRLGESDLGVNRQRIEAIRATLKAS
ncbi:DUF1499 domain-containing protein [Leptothermofonsia sichuanensis E412]|uniref:DUF1499 domain-containing protein n=1 Tax=Leptothermofonsia sichuanensis TaxID=2917832 RepID=UPI001CA61F17|nr:DUF1499 domain-containing protein [Leptothermofonsia sichuanensis]QZZ20945.1 DUF1499 domain-containing protein [Leptothermofonsia sichuanensis E412]